MFVEFVGQSARDGDNLQANSARLVNLYREPAGGRAGYALKSVPGAAAFAALDGVFVRALAEVGGRLYAACGGRFYQIGDTGTAADLGAAADSAEASLAGNNGKVTLCTGGAYYLWNGLTLTNPPPGAFSAFGSLDYLANYTVLTEMGGRRFQWSGVADPASLNGLHFSTADGRDDNILRCMAINGLLYIFKERSHEVWYVTGAAGAAAFERQAGGVIDTGLKAFGLIAAIDGGAFFVGDDGRAHLAGAGPVSIPPVETAITAGSPQACLTFEDEGHTFCAITFADRPAWVYDLATGEWFERGQGPDLGPWRVSVSARHNGAWHVGRDGGEVLALGRTNSDAGLPLVRLAVSQTVEGDGAWVRVNEVEVFARTGFAAATVELRVSRDGGHTWSDPKPRSWAVGDYNRRLVWRALGAGRRFTAEVRMSDAAEVPINSQARVAT